MNIFSALADPNRRSIIEMLAQRGELTATEIYEQFPVRPPTISQHLKVLREANLVRVEKRAQQRVYSINPEAFQELENWARQLTDIWNRRFDAIERAIEAEKKRSQNQPNR